MINWLQTYFNTSEEFKGEKQKSVIIYSPFQTFTAFIFLCSIKGVCLSLPFSLFVTQSYWLQKTWIIVYDVINMWYELVLSVSCHFGVWQAQPPTKKKKEEEEERNRVIRIWNFMKESKRWHNAHLWANYSFKCSQMSTFRTLPQSLRSLFFNNLGCFEEWFLLWG